MASNYTEKYELCQWEETDAVLRTDFNKDNAKIEAALAGLEKNKASYTIISVVTNELASLRSRMADVEKRLDVLES